MVTYESLEKREMPFKICKSWMLTKRSHKELLLYLKNVCIYFCHLCRRELIHCSVMLTKQFLSGFIDGVVRASLVIHNDCHSLNLPELLRVNIQMLVGVLSKGHKCWSNFVVQLPGLPSRLLTLSNERRGRIATVKCVKHRKTTCSGLSEGNAYSVDANEMEVLSHSKGNPNVCIRSLCDQSAKLSHQNNDNVGVYSPYKNTCTA